MTHQNADGERGVRNPGRMQNDPLTLFAQQVAKDLHSLGTAISLGLDEFPALRGKPA